MSTSPWPSTRSRRSPGEVGCLHRRLGYLRWWFFSRTNDCADLSSRSPSSTPWRRQASTDRGEWREKHPSLLSKGATTIPVDDCTDAALAASFLPSVPINSELTRSSTMVPLTVVLSQLETTRYLLSVNNVRHSAPSCTRHFSASSAWFFSPRTSDRRRAFNYSQPEQG